MQEAFTFTDHDEGKRVVDARGEKVGVVADVRNGTAYIDSDPSLTDTVMSKLGWNKVDEGTYPLDPDRIHLVTDDEIRLSGFENW